MDSIPANRVNTGETKRIAVVGSGISGLSAAYYLSRLYRVTLFECHDYIGGHTHTHNVTVDDKSLRVDTGFIVHNDRTYPYFSQLINELGCRWRPTEMSFSVKSSTVEYNGHNLNTLFCQRRNLLNPRFLRMVKDILRFNKQAHRLDSVDKGLTIGEYLDQHQYSAVFANQYLLPMAAAIWSTGTAPVRAFPVDALTRFFKHHGLLDLKNRPQWRVMEGGSDAYIEPMLRTIEETRTRCAVLSVKRQPEHVSVSYSLDDRIQETEHFDQIVLATHSDQALALLADPSDAEVSVLSQMKYAPNSVTLHTDASIMPKRNLAWASWNYLLDTDTSQASLTYDMNRLQHLETDVPVLVTLNDHGRIATNKVIRKINYAHPFYDHQMLDSQSRWGEVSGINRTHYAGAYWRDGFHEDGVFSALRVCDQLGVGLC